MSTLVKGATAGASVATKLVKIGRIALTIIKTIGTLLKGFRSFSDTPTKRLTPEEFREQERDFLEGIFKKCFSLNNVEFTTEALLNILGERIISVKRCASSLTKAFPSGIFSLFTMVTTGQAVRHEFAIVHTEHHVMQIQITKKSSGGEAIVEVQILRVTKENPRDKLEDSFHSQHWYSRVMKEVKGEELLEGFTFNMLNIYLNYLIAVIRKIGANKYDIFSANCKSFSRSILYFSKRKRDFDINTVIQSNLGVFTDKPLYIGGLLAADSIILEKTVYWSAYGVSNKISNSVLVLEACIVLMRGEDLNEKQQAALDTNLNAVEENQKVPAQTA